LHASLKSLRTCGKGLATGLGYYPSPYLVAGFLKQSKLVFQRNNLRAEM